MARRQTTDLERLEAEVVKVVTERLAELQPLMIMEAVLPWNRNANLKVNTVDHHSTTRDDQVQVQPMIFNVHQSARDHHRKMLTFKSLSNPSPNLSKLSLNLNDHRSNVQPVVLQPQETMRIGMPHLRMERVLQLRPEATRCQ
jgi:hypothetical protein